MIKVTDINISFEKPLIKDGALLIINKKVTCIIGESGSGKTTLLYILGHS